MMILKNSSFKAASASSTLNGGLVLVEVGNIGFFLDADEGIKDDIEFKTGIIDNVELMTVEFMMALVGSRIISKSKAKDRLLEIVRWNTDIWVIVSKFILGVV